MRQHLSHKGLNMESIVDQAKHTAINRKFRTFDRPKDASGNYQRITEYYGKNVFHFSDAKGIPSNVRIELESATSSGGKISKEHADVVTKQSLSGPFRVAQLTSAIGFSR